MAFFDHSHDMKYSTLILQTAIAFSILRVAWGGAPILPLDPEPLALGKLIVHADYPAILVWTDEHRFSKIVSPFACPCSPSGRGYPPLTDPVVQRHVATVRCLSSRRCPAFKRKALKAKWDPRAVIARFGYEGHVNLDAFLRASSRSSLCIHDRRTGRNLWPRSFLVKQTRTVSLRGCDELETFASSAKQRRGFVPSPAPRPATSDSQATTEWFPLISSQEDMDIVIQGGQADENCYTCNLGGNTCSITCPPKPCHEDPDSVLCRAFVLDTRR